MILQPAEATDLTGVQGVTFAPANDIVMPRPVQNAATPGPVPEDTSTTIYALKTIHGTL